MAHQIARIILFQEFFDFSMSSENSSVEIFFQLGDRITLYPDSLESFSLRIFVSERITCSGVHFLIGLSSMSSSCFHKRFIYSEMASLKCLCESANIYTLIITIFGDHLLQIQQKHLHQNTQLLDTVYWFGNSISLIYMDVVFWTELILDFLIGVAL